MKNKKIQYLIILILVLLLVFGIVIYLYVKSKENRTYQEYDVINSTSLEISMVVGYATTREGVFLYSHDGAEVIDANGNTLWKVSYSMVNPIAAVSGSCGVVGDEDGNTLYVFDGSGSADPIQTEHPIRKVEVSNQGVAAVWTDDGKQDYIILYDKTGKKLDEINTLVSNNGFPVDIAISKDGTKFVTSFVSFEDEKLRTQVTFYNFGTVGANYVDGLVGLDKYENQLLADVAFLNNNVLAAFGDNGIELYRMEEIPEHITTITISDKIRSVAYSDTYIGVITAADEGDAKDTITIYDVNGAVVEKKNLDRRYQNFQIDGTDVILYDDLEAYIYRIGGSDKIHAEFSKNVRFMQAVDGKNHFLVVGDEALEQIQLIGEVK